MAVHESVARLYDGLYSANPRLQLSQCTQMTQSNWLSELGDSKSYDKYDSFLFQIQIEPKLDYNFNGKIAITNYSIILAVGLDGVTKNPTSDNIYQKCIFYENFFAFSPHKLCIKKDCRCSCPNFSKVDGIWCYTCYGNQHHTYHLPKLMHDAIDFRDIPKEALYYIGESVTILDVNDEASLLKFKALMEKDKQRIQVLETDISSVSARIGKIIADEMTKNAENKLALASLLTVHNGSIDPLIAKISNIDECLQKLDKIKEAALKEAERKKMQDEVAGMMQNRDALSTRIEELTEKILATY